MYLGEQTENLVTVRTQFIHLPVSKHNGLFLPTKQTKRSLPMSSAAIACATNFGNNVCLFLLSDYWIWFLLSSNSEKPNGACGNCFLIIKYYSCFLQLDFELDRLSNSCVFSVNHYLCFLKLWSCLASTVHPRYFFTFRSAVSLHCFSANLCYLLSSASSQLSLCVIS